MSSTNRGAERSKDDYYHTPIDTIQTFWGKFSNVEKIGITDFVGILDPCAGGDENRPCAYPAALSAYEPIADDFLSEDRFITYDIRQDSRATFKEDYLQANLRIKYPIIISNPPYSLFERFLEKAMNDVIPNGYVIFLLRLNAAGGQKRRVEFWDKYKPKAIFVHSKRPCFTKGGSDSCEYAHFVWQKGYVGETKFYWV